jgi:Tat protein translocase TatB subunit
MFNVGGPELIVIMLVALVVLGPTRLPDAARNLGKAMAEFRRISGGFKAELRDALNEPVQSRPSRTASAPGADDLASAPDEPDLASAPELEAAPGSNGDASPAAVDPDPDPTGTAASGEDPATAG